MVLSIKTVRIKRREIEDKIEQYFTEDFKLKNEPLNYQNCLTLQSNILIITLYTSSIKGDYKVKRQT